VETILYEQAANELLRVCLRLEHCHEQLDYYLNNPSQWDSRQALTAIIDMLQVLDRPDLKSKLTGECSRLCDTLNKVRQTAGVDEAKLQIIVAELQESLTYLNHLSGKFIGSLRENYFIEHIRQLMQGSLCPVDTPTYHYWLSLHAENRIEYLNAWRAHFAPVYRIIKLILRLIRHSQTAKSVSAQDGFFQHSLESKQQISWQLIRVDIPKKYSCYPEISIGKHRLCIRFLSLIDFQEKPGIFSEPMQFELTTCLL
jgi:cell division protein ZapD